MKLLKNWKLLGSLMLVLLSVSSVLVLSDIGQSQSTNAQPAPPVEMQEEEVWDELDWESLFITEEMELGIGGEFARLAGMQPGMPNIDPEQAKLAQQNRLLLLINGLELSKEQLTQLKAITSDLIQSRDKIRSAIAGHQKEVNAFLLKFQGTEEELKSGLQSLRQGLLMVVKSHLEKVAEAEKAVKEMLSFEQGEKLMRAIHGGIGPGHRMMQRPGSRMFFMERLGERIRGRAEDLRARIQTWRQQNPARQPMVQQRQQLPKIGQLGRVLMRHLDVLDAALAAKLAALGS
jgi:hypothetical protein